MKSNDKGLCFLFCLLLVPTYVSGGLFSADRPPLIEEFSEDYGVDVTAPIHHYLDERSYFGKRYDKMIGGYVAKDSMLSFYCSTLYHMLTLHLSCDLCAKCNHEQVLLKIYQEGM